MVTSPRGNSYVVDTPLGAIEYGERGAGSPVLISHGSAGGYDQGLLIAHPLGGPYRFVCPSRAGYLRAASSVATTPSGQARAHAALLDALGIDGAAIVGVSAGGMSAAVFALEHPERCRALVLISAIVDGSRPPIRLRARAALLRLGPMFRLLSLLPPLTLARLARVPRDARALIAQDAEAQGILRGFLVPLPTRVRRAGMVRDTDQAAALRKLALERIVTPTLTVHGRADAILPFTYAERLASRLPRVTLLPVDGDHYCLITHRAMIGPAVASFLAAPT